MKSREGMPYREKGLKALWLEGVVYKKPLDGLNVYPILYEDFDSGEIRYGRVRHYWITGFRWPRCNCRKHWYGWKPRFKWCLYHEPPKEWETVMEFEDVVAARRKEVEK